MKRLTLLVLLFTWTLMAFVVGIQVGKKSMAPPSSFVNALGDTVLLADVNKRGQR